MSDEARVAQATFEDGRWVGPWEDEKCEHGKPYRFRWVIMGKEGRDPKRRPTVEDFEGNSEPETTAAPCSKCYTADDDCPVLARFGEHRADSVGFCFCGGYLGSKA